MMHKCTKAIFPGTFDPITNGHLDVIHRGIKLFDELIIAVGKSPLKNEFFSPAQRVEMIKELIADLPKVYVQSYDCLTVEYAAMQGADVMLRGLRNLTDVQYEFQMALTNRSITGIETIFIMTGEQYGFTSSTLIREVARYGGDVSGLVPENVYKKLQEKLKNQNGF